MRTRRSHRSRSKSRDRRDHGDSDRRRSSRERRSERSYRDRRSRSRDRHHRDRDYERERDRDRRRDRDAPRRDHRDHDYDREERDRHERRRKRDEDVDERDDERSKRKREGSILPVSASTDGRRPPSRDSDRRSSRGVRDNGDSRSNRHSSPRSPPSRIQPIDAPAFRRPSPTYEDGPPVDPYEEDVKEDDSEQRSVFVSQLAAKMTARDLGYFFEDKLGDNTVMDSRIVTDRLSKRSKGIAYVEFRTMELVEKAIDLTGTIVMGLPIMIQHTEAERNKTHAGDGSINLPPGVSGQGATLYVGSLHFNLTESDIKQVFEPFGSLSFVDLHKDPSTGRSKGYAFVHYHRAEDAKMALEQMEGFELAGRQLRVNTVHEKGQTKYLQQDSLEESGGTNLNAASRQALMQKLMRTETPVVRVEPITRPTISSSMTSKSVLLNNMFNPDEETDPNWDKDLAEEVKGECEGKYGKVLQIKVEKDSEGEIYVQFDSIDSAKSAIDGLNGRWFGGKQVSATFISDVIMQAHR